MVGVCMSRMAFWREICDGGGVVGVWWGCVAVTDLVFWREILTVVGAVVGGLVGGWCWLAVFTCHEFGVLGRNLWRWWGGGSGGLGGWGEVGGVGWGVGWGGVGWSGGGEIYFATVPYLSLQLQHSMGDIWGCKGLVCGNIYLEEGFK